MKIEKQIWVLPELNNDGNEPSKQTLGLLSEARSIAEKVGGNVTAIIFIDHPIQIPEVFSQFGVSKVITYRDSLFSHFNAEAYAAALLPQLKKNAPSLFLMGDTATGRELAPYLAAKLKSNIVTSCVKMDFTNAEHPFFYRSVYSGQLYQEISCDIEKTNIVTLDTKHLFVIPAGAPGKVESEVIEPKLSTSLVKTTHLESLPADFKTVDVTEADTIVSAGMGAISDELYPLVMELASLVEGSIGATRPVIDSGKVTRDRLIGQTGKTVSPDFYLALGISGATHHTGGIQESGKIVAVNRDPQAAIFQNADTGAVADLKEVLPKLIERIKKAKADGEIL